MSDNVKLLYFRHQVPAQEYEMLRCSGALDRYLGGVARAALADRLVRESAVEKRVIDPDPDDWRGADRVTVRWTVGVIASKDELNAFDRQLDEARAAGMSAAAELALAKASRYRGPSAPCGHVVRGALEELARSVQEEAARIMRADAGAKGEQ